MSKRPKRKKEDAESAAASTSATAEEPVASLGPRPDGAFMGIALLGWMEHEPAIRFLMEDCLFEKPLTEPAADSLWREWRDRAATLPERPALAPDPVPLTEPEREHAARFLEHVRALGAADVQVVKLDPMQLVVAQYCITIDIAAAYAERCRRDDDWLTQALPLSVENPNVNISFTRRNFDTDIDIDLPHAEFIFGVHPHGGFGPKEFLGYVMVKNLGSRMLLGKGYHRLYGRVSSVGASLPERLSLVAIEPGVLTPPSSEAASGPGLEIFGPRPALFSDFFTEGLAMPVYLRRKRYQLQVRSRWVAINES